MAERSKKPAVHRAGHKESKNSGCLLMLWKRSAGPLLGRDGFDDELPSTLCIEGRFRAVQRQVHKALNVGFVQYGGISQSDMPHDVTLALKTPLRVGEPGSLKKAQRHPA